MRTLQFINSRLLLEKLDNGGYKLSDKIAKDNRAFIIIYPNELEEINRIIEADFDLQRLHETRTDDTDDDIPF